ncbi:hypothetical protein FNV43_RR05833 [Rhamnella rubrinervis]|uniref:NAD(P)H-quinone oxidoreductase subunit 6, chloroplastic n=1 Tax=Rhamnella rubrinervis TaxID=2594499 RepID=A0A8K0HCG3_9ROSA|nr:hypothetical protein FNV43_RR05833 [Rhamnella rubrinervis]
MDLPGPIHDFLLVFLGSGLILGGIGVVLLPNPIYSAFSLGLVLVCISLFYILLNSYFVATALLIYVGAINVLIIFAVMFMNGSEYYKDFHLWTVGSGVTLLVCTSIFLLMTTITDTSWYGIIWTTRSNQIIEQDLINTHGEAHYSTCMLLAGILLKMGAYGLVRINMELFPHAHSIFSPWLIIVGTIQIIYAASTSPGQRNLKKRIAYSSVSHMGFIIIGIGSISDTGLNGAILQIISHGFIGAALFFLAGTSYDRIRLVYLDEMGGMAIAIPKYSRLSVSCRWPLLHYPKKVASMPFSDESDSPTISSTNKVIKCTVITIETTEKDI